MREEEDCMAIIIIIIINSIIIITFRGGDSISMLLQLASWLSVVRISYSYRKSDRAY